MRYGRALLPLLISPYSTAQLAPAAPDPVFSEHTEWHDEAGRPLALSRYLHQGLVVISMAFTSCQRTCPMTLQLMRAIEVKLAAKNVSASFVILSLDPAHDTPDAIRSFFEKMPVQDRNTWHFLRGTEAATKAVASALAIDAFQLDDHIIHKFKIWVYNANGQPVHTYDWQHRDLSDL